MATGALALLTVFIMGSKCELCTWVVVARPVLENCGIVGGPLHYKYDCTGSVYSEYAYHIVE